jgi:hypothetical protein
MRQVIHVPDWLPPTTNQLMRGKIRTRIRLGKSCRNMIFAYAFSARIVPAQGKRRVTIRLSLGPGRRGCDVDAPQKAVLDALKHARAIRGDTREWCELAPVEFVEHSAADAITIVVEDI